MKRQILWLAVVLVVVAAAALGGYWLWSSGRLAQTPAAPAEEAGAGSEQALERIVLLHTNDFHGAIEAEEEGAGERGGLVNLVSLIDEVRAQDPGRTLLLDAGDTFQGTYVSNSTQGEVVMAAMNLAGYDAWTLGNHEFDWGQEVLQARISEASFPVLAANVQNATSGEVWEQVQPFAILQAGAARVAVLGLSYPDTPVINRPENVAGLAFRGAEETVTAYLPELEEQADLIVVLSHAGLDGDRALAEAVDGIDVIIGGHSHAYLNRPEKVGDTLVVQAGSGGQVLGRLEMTVDLATGMIAEYSSSDVLLPVSDQVEAVNAEAQALVEAALAQAAETMDLPIGETARALAPRREGEFALGNLVVDAMLAAPMSDGLPADIAMHNNGGIRAELPKGEVTFGQLYAVLPFDNQLVALDLTGAQVLRILEHSVEGGGARMQVGGMAFRYNSAKLAGQRILEATVGGEPLDPEGVYRVVTIDYLAAGGDGQDTFVEGTNLSYGDTEVWAVAEYIGAHSPVDAQIEGRIRGR
jgi:2',3'-cyclic-nucleotide 2'-phosphodiesterase (5'-nucleotidase family)